MRPNAAISTSPREIVNIDGLQVYLKAGVSSNVLEFDDIDYHRMVQGSLSLRSVGNSDLLSITLEELAEITEYIILNNSYPSNLDELSENDTSVILNDFPELKNYEDIIKHQAVIKKIYQAQGTYQLLEKIKEHSALRYSHGYLGTQLNKAEFWLLARYFWKINGTNKAKYGGAGWLDKGDAFRHAIWNILIAKYTDGTKAQRFEWAKKFTDAHEYGSPTPDNYLDNPMDYHNNAIRRDYWNQTVSGSWWTLNIPSDSTIIDSIYVKSQNAVFCQSEAEINAASGRLVYVK